MKMKFRADGKDILIFCIFCVILLYFVSIGVLNAYEFLDTGLLWGFNPLPAFSAEFIAPTMVIYLGSLIAIIASVSSYFFEREKGFGVKASKKEESGYSRWLTDKEMKKNLKQVAPSSYDSDSAGIPLINDGKELWVDSGEFHNLILGSTGSGKTQMMVQPMVRLLAKKGESMIITDPKGEIYENNAEMLREKGYNVILLNFRDPQKGSAWNPMELPYSLYKTGNSDKANELLDDLAMNILYDEKAQNNDPFWEKTSADYFTGLSLALFDDADSKEINLNSINLMTTAGEDKYLATTYIKDYFSYKNQASPAYINVASTLMAPADTKSSILSVFKQKIKLFSSRENLSEMLSHSDFDMKDIGRKKTAVFIVIQDEKKTYHSLVTIFIKQCYETLIDVAQENGGKLPFKTNFILDEFANMPPLKDVTTMITAARSRNIRFTLIIQNFAQLYQVYGKENGETIKGNCGNIIYLISSELASLEEISKLCGEKKSKEKEKTASVPLVTVSDLQRLKEGTVIVLRIRQMPFKTTMIPDWKMQKEGKWGKEFPKATYPQREKQEIAMFDIKAWCDENRKKRMGDLNLDGGFNPFAGNPMPFGGGMNPFMNNQPINPQMPVKPEGDFNIDDLVKRIDAKIAELEAEEVREKEEQATKGMVKTDAKTSTDYIEPAESIEPVVVEPIEPVENIKQVVVEPIKPVENIKQEVVNIPTEPIVNDEQTEQVKKNYITDDQFFDDFFSDE